MDRGIPTEATLRDMRQSDPPVSYLVGTPRARWEQFREEFEKLPWQKLRDAVEVKLLAHGEEVYVLAQSQGRRAKERAILAWPDSVHGGETLALQKPAWVNALTGHGKRARLVA